MLGAAFLASADQVTLKNGDRLTGSVVKSDPKSLVLKSQFAGTVTIDWPAIDSITSSEPLSVTLKGGEVLVGPITTSDGKLEVQTANAGRVSAPRDAVTSIRSKDEQAAYDRQRNPRLVDLWTGFLDASFNTASGNTATTSISLNLNAARTTTKDKTTAYLTSLYANNATNNVKTTSAQTVRGGLGYNLNLTPRTFAFANTDLEYDKLQKLDLRFVLSGGGGYYVVKTDRKDLGLFAGGSLNKEFYSTGLKRTSGEGVFKEEFNFKISKAASLHELLVIYPNLTDVGEFRMNFDLGLVTAIRRWLSWQVSASDRYISNPVIGAKTNDVLLTTGIRITFAK